MKTIISMMISVLAVGFMQSPVLGQFTASGFKSQHNCGVSDNNSLHPLMQITKDGYILDGFSLSEVSIDKIEAFIASAATNRTRELIPINDSIYIWSWDTLSNNWKSNPISRSINIVYDTDNNLISILYEQWNGLAWVNSDLITYTYDADNNQTSTLYQYWGGLAWVNFDLETYTYDADNNQTSTLYQYWEGLAWVNSDLETYTYDAGNNQTSYLYQYWDGLTWMDWYLSTYTYDANNILTGYFAQEWNGSVWVNSSLGTYTYDESNYLISSLYKHWNGSAWQNFLLYNYTYDASYNIISLISQLWNGSTFWYNSHLYTYTYDENNNQTSNLYQTWNGIAWVNQWHRNSVFDNNNFKVSDAYKNFNTTGTNVEYGDSTYYYFHPVEVGIAHLMLHDGSIVAYPNPANEFITFDLGDVAKLQAKLFIYNSSGALLKQIPASHSTQLTVSVADIGSDGMYFYTVRTSDQQFFAGKFIIQR